MGWPGFPRTSGERRHGRRVHHREPPPAGLPSCARPARSEGAGARILRGGCGETGEGLWTACASRPPPAASASGRVQMRPARGGAAPRLRYEQQAHPGACRCGPQGGTTSLQSMNRRMDCPPGRGGWARTPTTAPLMRRASQQRRGRLVPVRRATMRPHAWCMDAIEVRAHCRGIEMTNGQQSTGEDGRWTLDGRRQCRV